VNRLVIRYRIWRVDRQLTQLARFQRTNRRNATDVERALRTVELHPASRDAHLRELSALAVFLTSCDERSTALLYDRQHLARQLADATTRKGTNQ
jgi:hypothetical protein